MLRSTNSKKVDLLTITTFKASLNSTTEYKLGCLRGFLLSWHEYGFDGIEEEVIDFLEESILRKNVQGKAVTTKCPYSGAYTTNEQRAMLDWCTNAFTQDELDIEEFSIFISLLFTGRRPSQIRYLRTGDLLSTKKVIDQNEVYSYELNIPRLKQKGMGFREAMAQIDINEDLYQLLSSQSLNSITEVEKQLRQELPQHLKTEIPIYINRKNLSAISSLEILKYRLKNDYLHQTSSNFSNLIRRICTLNTAISERTRDFIHISSRRFRYTKGTNLVRLGVSGIALAKALDHSDTQSIPAYVENTAEMADQINEMIAPALAPIAQAFSGTLIESEREAIRANDPHSRIKSNQSKILGNCGTNAFCASGYKACYTCMKFQPWRDAPHEDVRNEILVEREKQSSIGVSKLVIQATERLLLAVEQVIQMCKKMKLECTDD